MKKKIDTYSELGNELNKALRNLFDEFVKTIRLNKFLDWFVKILNSRQK